MSYDICPDSNLITQGYGCTTFQSEWLADGLYGRPKCPTNRLHTGMDFGMGVGGQALFRHPTFVTRAGVVVAVGASPDPGFQTYLGNQAVSILMDDDRYILYAHLDEAKVAVGQRVKPRQVAGLVGTRGNSTGPHLHIEVRTDGPYQTPFHSIDPTPYLSYLEADMDANDRNFLALIWRVHALINNLDTVQNGPTKGEANKLKAEIDALKAAGSGLPASFDATIAVKPKP